MNEKLQQAIAAVRNGQNTEAQLFLTEVLQGDPNETQAWFLLSTLVDSKQKKAAYLGKVLALDPNHEMAQMMLDRLQEASAPAPMTEFDTELDRDIEAGAADDEERGVSAEPTPVVVSANTADFLAQERGDTLPEWLIEEDGLDFVDDEPEIVEMLDDEEAGETSDIPDWLKDEIPASWADDEIDAVDTAVTREKLPQEKIDSSSLSKPKSKASDNLQRQQKFLTGILYALVVVAIVVFVILIYLAWTTLL